MLQTVPENKKLSARRRVVYLKSKRAGVSESGHAVFLLRKQFCYARNRCFLYFDKIFVNEIYILKHCITYIIGKIQL